MLDHSSQGSLNSSNKERPIWPSRFQFLMSSIAFAIDSSNVFRFPYLCYEHGGGAFLIPYFLTLFSCAMPLLYMELILGQSFHQGCISLWKIVPLFKGIGLASCCLTLMVALYYNIVIAWSLFYMLSSFNKVLPWVKCTNSWNTPNCSETLVYSFEASNLHQNRSHLNFSSPAREFYERRLLGLEADFGFGYFGKLNWELFGCITLIYLTLFLCLFKGIRSLGKVSWLTVLLSYTILIVMLARAATLKGSKAGALFYLSPSFEKLKNLKIWFVAASQAFFSIGVGFGVHVAFASYNPTYHPVHTDCLMIIMVNAFTTLLSGFAIFAILGYLSLKESLPINEAVEANMGMIFVTYSTVFSTLSMPQFWCILFFLMLITLGIGSSYGAIESFLTAIQDEFPSANITRKWLTLVTLLVLFLVSIPFICTGGFYLTHFLDKYACSASLLCISLVKCVVVAYVYGTRQFALKVEETMNRKCGLLFRITFKFLVPPILTFMLVFDVITDSTIVTEVRGRKYRFPDWSRICGGLVVSVSVILIPVAMLIQFGLMRNRGSLGHRMKLLITPESEHEQLDQTGYCERTKVRQIVASETLDSDLI